MNAHENWTIASISPSQVEAIVRHARQERAKAMRTAIARLPALLKRLIAYVRPNRQRLPQAGAWA